MVLPNGIKNTKAFFEGIRSVGPLDPPALSDNNWDALSDSLWEGIYSLDANKIAFMGPGSAEMANAKPQDFKNATIILSDLTELLGNDDAIGGNPKQVLVVLS